MNDDRTTGKVFNLGCGKNYSVKEIYYTISDLLHSNISPTYKPDLPGEAFANLADITEAKKLGWEPKIDLVEGLQTAIDYIRNEINLGKI